MCVYIYNLRFTSLHFVGKEFSSCLYLKSPLSEPIQSGTFSFTTPKKDESKPKKDESKPKLH